jgi:hypothetical protein
LRAKLKFNPPHTLFTLHVLMRSLRVQQPNHKQKP